jgi:hypothetical protein
LVEDGSDRHGDTLYAHSPITSETVAITLTNPVFVDPAGGRLHG